MLDYNKGVQQRLRIVSVMVILISAIFLWRLFTLQVTKHEHYIALAQDQQRFEKIDMAQRGKIYVRDSYADKDKYYPLAFDVKSFAVWVVPRNVKSKENISLELSSLLSLPQSEIFEAINNDKLYIPPIKKGLTLDQANEVKAKKLSGVLVVPEYSRYYPESTLASQVLGFVNSDGEGNYGLEGHYNEELKGLAGTTTGEKDTLGRIINLLDQKKPEDGTSYVLTIDRSVQFFVEQKLEEAIQKYQAESGTVVIIDIQSGGVLAMASTPTYDPNKYREYAKDQSGLYVNPAIAHLYEPGSVMKPIVMAAALDAGVVASDTKERFGNYTVVDGYEIHNAEDRAFGEETMADVIKNSDNVGMVWLSKKLGKEKMYSYVDSFGFFRKTGIDLDTEVRGYGPSLKNLRNINLATMSFGQGISVTPIEMAAAYAAIANRGVYLYPRVVDVMINNDEKKEIGKQEGERIVAESAARQVIDMLVYAVEQGHGWRAKVPGFKVAGKTGTAQIPKAEGGYEEDIFNHTFAGLAPADDPRFAMIVKLDKPKASKYAESTSAPLFGEIAYYLLNFYYRLSPQ